MRPSPENGAVPGGWQLVRLGDVAEIVMGQSPPGATVFDWNGDSTVSRGLPFIQGNAEFGPNSPKPLKWCAQPAKVARVDDILISVRAPVGETNRVNTKIGIGRGLAAIRFAVPDARAFGWHALNHAKNALEAVTQGSTFKAIGGQDLRSLSILLPPLLEQRAIAAVLDSIDGAIERTEAVIATTEQLHDSLLHKLLTHGVPGWHTDWKDALGVGTIPAGWEVVRLGEGVSHVGSGVTPKGGRSVYTASGIPFLRSQNIHFDGLRLEDVVLIPSEIDDSMHRSRVQPGDVLLNITGASIGRCTVAPIDLGPANVNQHVCIIRTTEEFNPRFVWKWLSTPRSQREIDEIQTGQSRQGLNYQQVRQLTIARPPRTEQDSIVEMLSGLDETLEAMRHERERLQSLTSSAADALLTGRVRVPTGKVRTNA